MKGAIIALVVGMLASGSINTISKKLGYSTCSSSPISGNYDSANKCKDFTPNGHQFRKPWTQTLVMFTGEAMCLLLFLYRRNQAKNREAIREKEVDYSFNQVSTANSITSPMGNFLSPTMARANGMPLLGDSSDDTVAKSDKMYNNVSCYSAVYCLVPAICDLGGTTVSGIGLLFTSASVFQMLRGSIIFFTAIFSVLFLNRKLQTFHWCGMGLTVVGVTMIGLSSILGVTPKADVTAPGPSSSSAGEADDDGYFTSLTSSPHSMVWVGNVLVVLSQLMSATQMVIEEKFLKSKKLPPEFVVGVEGSFGIMMMLAIALPVVGSLPGEDGAGMHENAIDAAYLFINSTPLMCMVLSYFISIAFYNFCGLAVAKELSSVHRCLIDACRTVLVWSIDLTLYYTTDGHYGEKWNPVGSWIQLAGFVVLIYGSCIYYKVIKLNCFKGQYEKDEQNLLDAQNAIDNQSDADSDYPPASLLGRDEGNFDSMYNQLDGE
jgi:drug/metabolite transporter (DMT)-like permease